MSTNYFIYTEVKLNSKWICINGKMPKLKYDYKAGQYKDSFDYSLVETYFNGSRSSFGTTYEKLLSIGRKGKFSDASDVIQQICEYCVEKEKQGENTYTMPIYIDYGNFKSFVDYKKFDRHGIISKDVIFSYENGDLEEIYEDVDNFGKLSDEEKKKYKYYEWDDISSWNYYFKIIGKKIEQQLSDFKELNYIFDEELPIRLVCIAE